MQGLPRHGWALTPSATTNHASRGHVLLPGSTLRRRLVKPALVAVIVMGATPFVGSAPATAAPNCGSSPAIAPGKVEAAEPWAQRRFDYGRLAGIADGQGITVAVIDSGVNAAHPQLSGAVTQGADALDPGGNGQLDCVGHGTAVASLIAARPAKGTAFRGVAPGVKVIPYRVSERQIIDGQSNGGRVASGADFAQAVNQAVSAKVAVINISMVMTEDNPALRRAVSNAIAHDIVVVAAAGNSHDKGDPTPYPAAYPGVIGVGAIAESGVRADMSQVGPYVDLVAPGSAITAALPGQGHVTAYEGTSFAAPFVSGVAALVRQYYPGLSASAVASRLTATADPAPGGPHGPEYGSGVVNPYRAVTEQIGGEPSRLLPLPPKGRDLAAEAAASRTQKAKATAMGIAAVVGCGALLVILAAGFIPAGRRRRWQPGLRPTSDGAPQVR